MYAHGMDITFKACMKWFGKKYGDFQLIKGYFLANQHREKTITASIVIIN